ncbi:MAG TPA: efflux RND transporter periplasmic adaptor subunit [Syntrophales bacterium]|nr:efflux RND transporter periplasmic adaptor subunit [Syntrophales bacterium]
MADEDLSGLKIERSERSGRKRRFRRLDKKWLLLAGAFIIAAILAWMLLGGGTEVRAVAVSQIYPYQSYTTLNASGYVVAQRRAAVASKVTGQLVALFVEEGSRIEKGQVIARLESRDVQARLNQSIANLNVARSNLAQAKAELQDAGKTFARQKLLFRKGFTARADLDAAQARLDKAEAAVAAAESAVRAEESAVSGARVAVEYTLIRAPFDSVVLTKNADVGDIVTPLGAAANAKSAVVTIADLDSLQVEADISESNLGLVKKGQPCAIQLDSIPDERFPGQVHMIVPTADRTKATVMTKIRFLRMDPRILPEMSAKVAFLSRPAEEWERKPHTAVPQGSVVSRERRETVFVIMDGRVEEVEVKTGNRINGMIEILQGLKSGERVVADPPARLSGGEKVRVVEK